MTFSEIVKPLDLTPTELSKKLGVSDGHVHDLLSGRRRLTIKVAARLEKVAKRKGIVAAVAAQEAQRA
jgi:plasmid maintenance system antidote protein VapI